MTAVKRILIAMIACALMLAGPITALAEGYAVYAGKDNAVVYNASGAAVGTVPADTKLELQGVKGNVCKVSYKGKTGYMNKSDLVKQTSAGASASDDGAAQVSKTAYVSKDGAKVYDADGGALGQLDLNTEVTVTAVKGNVCRIDYKGKTGYMRKSDLSASPVAQAEPQAQEESGQKAGKTAYVARDGAKVYDKSGSAIAALELNIQVTVTAVKGSLCQVAAGDKTGYMKKSDLSESKVSESQSVNRTAYVSTDGAKVYNSKGKVIAQLSLNAQVTVVAVSGKLCRISVGGNTGYMNAGDLSSKKTETQAEAQPPEGTAGASGSSATPARGTAKEMDWWTSDIQKIFARGTTATITDVETGLAWREQRRGGTNHADVQPLTAADTAALKQAYGGTWSWTRRAIFVTINGVNYAASMNGMPHGGGSIADNNFNGHHCIHFTNSRTHGSNRVCELHQAAIQKALQATL